MSEVHPNVRCASTWCKYWVRVFDETHGEHMGGCGAHTLLIATKSGDKRPTCVPYKVSEDPQKAGIHKKLCESCEHMDEYGCMWVHWVDPECKYVPRSSGESTNG